MQTHTHARAHTDDVYLLLPVCSDRPRKKIPVAPPLGVTDNRQPGLSGRSGKRLISAHKWPSVVKWTHTFCALCNTKIRFEYHKCMLCCFLSTTLAMCPSPSNRTSTSHSLCRCLFYWTAVKEKLWVLSVDCCSYICVPEQVNCVFTYYLLLLSSLYSFLS